jgi:DtxR family Mn-dependent transcriptional regulator
MTPAEKKAADFIITEEIIDELLECIWLMEERGKDMSDNKTDICTMVVDEDLVEHNLVAEAALCQIVKFDYITIKGNGVSLQKGGRERAKNIIRRKRLAEKLLAEVLSVGPVETRTTACRIEHVLSPEVTDSVCSFLGHPPTCPHGKPIPPGNCCKKLAHHMRPLVTPMTDLEPGSRARIVFIAPKDHGRMDRLSTLGIVPGTEILLHQKKPAFVIRAGETELALDTDIAGEIYVKRLS